MPMVLKSARELMENGKFDEALEIISNFEKNESLTPEVQLSTLLLKGRIYVYKGQYKAVIKIGEMAYQISQKRGNVSESINSLIFKAYIVFFGKYEQALDFTIEAEHLLNQLNDVSSLYLSRPKATILHLKSWVYLHKNDLEQSLKLATQSLELNKKINDKWGIAVNFIVLGEIYLNKVKFDIALDYAMKSLTLQEEINNKSAIAKSLRLIGNIYYFKGEFKQANKFCRKSLSIKESSIHTRINNLITIGNIVKMKGEMDRAFKYFKRALALAKEINSLGQIWHSILLIGSIYRIKGDFDQAIEHFEHSLILSEKIGTSSLRHVPLFLLIKVYLNTNNLEQAQQCLSHLKQTSGRESVQYLLAKAYILKISDRRRDRTEAEILLKRVIEDFYDIDFYVQSTIALCDLLLEELSIYNNPEVLNEINSLIISLLKVAEEQSSQLWLAETKLLQAKLALIQTNFDQAKLLLTQAQSIAELHGLHKWANKISGDHDTLLEQLNVWEDLKKRNAPMPERIKLASIEGVMDGIQGKHTVGPPEPVDEQSILLMIIAEGGVLIFSYPFSEEWKFDDELFGGFLTAFNSISDEIFSEGLDRVKFGKQTVLMEQVADFSICYLFKGQTYSAQKKLTKFVEEVQKNSSLWQSLERHYNASQVLELKESPQLKSLITEIFTSKS